jgi:hypothetical protein
MPCRRENKATMKRPPARLLFFGLLLCVARADQHEAYSPAGPIINRAVSRENPSERKLRDRLLKLTPLRSSPQQVLHVIADVLHKKTVGSYQKNFVSNYYNWGEMYVTGNIGILYDEKMSPWMTGTDTLVDWWFDEHNRLINVTVHESATGP